MAFRRMVLSEAIPITTAWVSPRLNPSCEKRFGAAAKTVAPTLQASTAFRRSEGDAWSLLANGVCRWREVPGSRTPSPQPSPASGRGGCPERSGGQAPSFPFATLANAGIDRRFRLTLDSPLTPNGPLSLRERTGVRERSQPIHRSRKAPFASKLAPTLTIPANAGIDRHFRLTLDSPLTPNGPLSLRERAGVRERRQPIHRNRQDVAPRDIWRGLARYLALPNCFIYGKRITKLHSQAVSVLRRYLPHNQGGSDDRTSCSTHR